MNPELPNQNNRVLNIVTLSFIIIFFMLTFFGNYGPDLMTNEKCYSLLGCNSGFFGYDALVHFVNGIMNTMLIIWLMTKFPSFNLFHNHFWKNFLMIIALVVLISFSWEFFEFSHDQFRMKIFHENLIIENRLDQPSNDDTMGDITFSILGATITVFVLKSFIKKE